jgi:hypothetical protein
MPETKDYPRREEFHEYEHDVCSYLNLDVFGFQHGYSGLSSTQTDLKSADDFFPTPSYLTLPDFSTSSSSSITFPDESIEPKPRDPWQDTFTCDDYNNENHGLSQDTRLFH